MKLVIIESPLAGDVEGNVAYAKECMRDSLKRGEAPYASHLLYAQPGVLDDATPDERELGLLAGFAWGLKADKTVVYADRGISPGMRLGIEAANKAGRPVIIRTLYGTPSEVSGYKLTFRHVGEHQHFAPSKGTMSVRIEAPGEEAATFFGQRLAWAMSDGEEIELESVTEEPAAQKSDEPPAPPPTQDEP